MAARIFHISGPVINHHIRQDLSGLRFETWGKDRRFDDPLDQTVSGQAGVFNIRESGRRDL